MLVIGEGIGMEHKRVDWPESYLRNGMTGWGVLLVQQRLLNSLFREYYPCSSWEELPWPRLYPFLGWPSSNDQSIWICKCSFKNNHRISAEGSYISTQLFPLHNPVSISSLPQLLIPRALPTKLVSTDYCLRVSFPGNPICSGWLSTWCV